MNDFYIIPTFIPRTCFVLLYAAFTVYLLTLKQKTKATWWLIGVCALYGSVDLGWELPLVIPYTNMSETVFHTMFLIGQGFFVPIGLTLVQFAYHFWGNPYPRESRIMFWIPLIMALSVLAVSLMYPPYGTVITLVLQITSLFSLLLLCLWSSLTFIRKAVLFSRDADFFEPDDSEEAGPMGFVHHLRYPKGRAARACRAFAGISFLLLMVIFGGFLAWGIGLFQEFGFQVYFVSNLLFLYALVVGYTSHAPQPTTVQVKLVGATIVTVLALLAVLTRTFFPEVERIEESDITLPPSQTMRFEPNPDGGYTISSLPLMLDEEPGIPITMSNKDFVPVPLSFPFRFYGMSYDSVRIGDDNLVVLGPMLPDYMPFMNWPLMQKHMIISPGVIDLDPTQGGQVTYSSAPDRAAITWDQVPLFDGRPTSTFQVVLYPSGTIDLNYGPSDPVPVTSEPDLQGNLLLGIRGIKPADSWDAQIALPETLNEPMRSEPGKAVIEDYGRRFYAYLERTGRPLLMMVLGSYLFIIFVFPYLFRRNLFVPLSRLLEGMQKVEAGKHDTVVEVQVEDEIGTLTQHFNNMAYSIRQAERKLQTYADTLEEQVRARTAELSKSLEELKTTQAQLIQAEKMASLGQMTAGIAHEIKNPLNFVTNFAVISAEMIDELDEELQALALNSDLQEVEELMEMLKANIEKINHHGRRADSIIQNMLEHSRATPSERRDVDLNPLLEEFINLAYHGKRARREHFNVTIRRDLDPDVGSIPLVPQDMGRVFLNILNNAFDAVAQKQAQSDAGYEPEVVVSSRLKADTVEIRIQDNGPGIPDEVMAHIFDPFFTTKPTGQGNTGLGLSLSYDIVTQGHAGTLTVESTESTGATFVITLPKIE